MKSIPHVELVFDSDCPNVDRARDAIRAALKTIGLPEEWQEWDRGSPKTPVHLRKLGSPSVLVDGRDVGCREGETADADANSCRIYMDESGCIRGAPSVQTIVKVLSESFGPVCTP